MVAGTQHYFAVTAKGPTGQIILRAGSAGARSTGSISVAAAPVEPLARLQLGAVTEAAVACAGRADIARAGAEYARAFCSLVEALRLAG